MHKVLVLLAVTTAASSAFHIEADTSHGRHNLIDLAKRLNLTKFVEALDETKISHVINHEGRFTVFAPTDAAFAREKKYPQEASLHDKVLLHIGQGEARSHDFVNELIIKTVQSKRTVRINKYPNGKITANGRLISSMDHHARNGIIHILDDVMSSVYQRAGSVVSELNECCPEHSMLLDLIRRSQLWEMLDDTGPYTLLAPTNEAFNKIHPDFFIHLKKNMTALRSFMLGHVIPLTHYSAGLEEGQVLKTALGNKLPVHFDDKGNLHLGKATVQLSDVTAVNGVVHVISEVLFPRNYTTEKKEANKAVQALMEYLGL